MNDPVDSPSIAAIYAEKIRPLRTRAYSIDVPPKENDAQIQHTLLGIELKVGRIRFACPDLATARYIRVFARLGCREFAIPYDITKISTAADELETAWQRTLLMLESETAGSSDQEKRGRRLKLLKSVREAIAEIGPGEKMPEFNRSTKQRDS